MESSKRIPMDSSKRMPMESLKHFSMESYKRSPAHFYGGALINSDGGKILNFCFLSYLQSVSSGYWLLLLFFENSHKKLMVAFEEILFFLRKFGYFRRNFSKRSFLKDFYFSLKRSLALWKKSGHFLGGISFFLISHCRSNFVFFFKSGYLLKRFLENTNRLFLGNLTQNRKLMNCEKKNNTSNCRKKRRFLGVSF